MGWSPRSRKAYGGEINPLAPGTPQTKPFAAPDVASLLASVQDTIQQNTAAGGPRGFSSFERPRVILPAPGAAPGTAPQPRSGGDGSWDGTPEGFARDLLGRLGAPDTPNNIGALVRWMRQEGGHYKNNAKFNPLNTSWDSPGSSKINSHGVRSYGDYETGVNATVKTLSLNYYNRILNALRRGNADPREIFDAIVSSPWGTKGL